MVLLNLTTGARVTSFKAAAPNGKVWSMAAHGNRLYVGGNFTTVGGVRPLRLRLARTSPPEPWTRS